VEMRWHCKPAWSGPSRGMSIFKLKLHTQIFLALVLAVVAGLLTNPETRLLGVGLFAAYDFVGSMFLNALRMLIVPIITSSIITGIAGIGSSEALGRLGGKTFAYYMMTSFLAIVVGILAVNLVQPGIVDGEPAREILGLSAEHAADVADKVGNHDASSLTNVFLSMIPPNIIAAAANGQLLGLIFFSLLYGFYMTRIGDELAQVQYNFWCGVYEIVMRLTELVMKFAPIGVFALVAKVVTGIGEEDLGSLVQSLGLFFITVVLSLSFHAFVTLPLLLATLARVNPLRHYKAMVTALLTAFSTASSSATLPLTIECVRDNAGVSNRVTSFVLPLGATINMDGTALYECVAAIFIAQAFGLELTFVTQFTILLIALLTSIGVAGIPAASLVAITIILSAIGLPLEAVGVILAVDRLLDMFRTSVNVFSDSCGAVIIARSEGETGILTEQRDAPVA
jgi:proton glutamate symport protein